MVHLALHREALGLLENCGIVITNGLKTALFRSKTIPWHVWEACTVQFAIYHLEAKPCQWVGLDGNTRLCPRMRALRARMYTMHAYSLVMLIKQSLSALGALYISKRQTSIQGHQRCLNASIHRCAQLLGTNKMI